MDSMERHEMKLEATYPTGAEEWYCPSCGRRFLMQWPPHDKRIMMERGNENAIHSAGKGGLQIGSARAKDNRGPSSSDLNLGSWLDGLQGIDLDL